MADLRAFGLADMTALSAVTRRMGAGARSMEEVAARVVNHLRADLVDGDSGKPSSVLVRFFKTHALGSLPDELQAEALGQVGCHSVPSRVQCLVLLATAGTMPEWNDRRLSRGHRAIPLPTVAAMGRTPMISQLVKQLGIDVDVVLRPVESSILVEVEQRAYNVFHVQKARGSEFIPAQDDFVIPHGVRSVLGFGGILTGGSMFAIILFSSTPIPRQTADLFKTIAASVKVAVTPFSRGPIFASP